MVGILRAKNAPPFKKQQQAKFRLRDPESTNNTSNTAATPVVKTPLPPPTPNTAEAPEKIKKLENELTKLRDEINKLMSNTKPAPVSHSVPPPPPMSGYSGSCGTVSFPAQPVVPHSFVPTTNTTTSTAPPPAPPPPPAPGTPKIKAPPVVERVVSIFLCTYTVNTNDVIFR